MPGSRGKVLIVDDAEANVRFLRRCLSEAGYQVFSAADGGAALEAVAAEPPDIVLLDVIMPGLDGFEVCRRLKQNAATRLIPVVLLTALTEREKRIEGANAGADDFLSKPVDIHELKARVASLVRMKRYTDDLDSAAAIIMSFAQIIEARDPYTQGHCYRLANYGTVLGRQLGLSDDDLQALHRGGFLHDIGKVAVPDAILLKPGSLTSEERRIIEQHPVIGDGLCGNLRSLRGVRAIVRSHHERIDGSGYPDGLVGDGIPLLAQIVGIVDVYDALTTDRPYRPALSCDQAFAILENEIRLGWRRKDLVTEFIALAVEDRFRTFTVDGASSAIIE